MSHKPLLRGVLKNGLYQLDLSHFGNKTGGLSSAQNNLTEVVAHSQCNNVSDSVVNKHMTWHSRLGHPCASTISTVLNTLKIPVKSYAIAFCDACKLGKLHQMSFHSVVHLATAPFQIIHADVWGPSSTLSMDGYRYYLVIVDDYTRYTWIFPLKLKSEVASVMCQFISFVERQFSTKIKTI